MKYFKPYGLSWKSIWNVFSISNIYINLSNASVMVIDISKFKSILVSITYVTFKKVRMSSR